MSVQLFAVTGSHGTAGAPPGTELLTFRDLAAVVGKAAPDGDVALAHYRKVVECVFRRQGVLPAPPGTVFRDRDLVAQWLELHYFTLLDTLGFVDDRAVARVTVVRSPVRETAEEPVEEVNDVLDVAAETVLQDALRVLRRHAVASVGVGGGGSGRSTAASFLVDRELWNLFAEMVERESARLPDFTLSLSGPWPAYDFVRMRFGS